MVPAVVFSILVKVRRSVEAERAVGVGWDAKRLHVAWV
jgi:hypothetical protein